MIRLQLLAMAVVVALCGCGGSREPAAPVDPELERHADAGQRALALERPQQAVAQYRDALTRARERDDADAIADLGFDLAVAELAANQPEAASKTATEVDAELRRRGVVPPAALELAHAVSLYRLGQAVPADRLAARVEAATDQEAAARAAFLRGLIADDAGDVAGLHAALSRITDVSGAEHQADVNELSARLALREGDPRTARVQAEKAAAVRRDLVDYRSLARCLALEAKAAAAQGDANTAADLYLRAGRTAAGQGDPESAKRWLTAAIASSRDPMLTQTARSLLTATEQR